MRYLSNELETSLVCLGVMDARVAIAGDTQLSRHLDQIVLPRWKVDEEFHELVSAVCGVCPSSNLRPYQARACVICRASATGSLRAFSPYSTNWQSKRSERARSPSPMWTSSHENMFLRRKPCSLDGPAEKGISNETRSKIASREMPQIGPFIPSPGLKCQSTAGIRTTWKSPTSATVPRLLKML
ncbi:TniB family NTP-binding protein [Methylocystis sp. MJC1]|uniref:TniB family NTP-binding protein n=1 Tax=Methylocystis sp. MJC1 TaxID=2654282 RepID=UPI0013EBEA46|nr:TniB family NTP-binding protein [Methylocystis sp. MJC1]